MFKPELLAPAGDLETMKIAVDHGADAVYFGAEKFSARAYAKNFTLKDIKEGVQYCHSRGVKAYCAVNTLLFNAEVAEAIELLYDLACAQVDAVIVQDVGLASLIRDHVPQLPLHGSTQMVIHNKEGAEFLRQFGFERVVLSRECSLDDVKSIYAQTDIELEVFIHGALCICYSGLCQLSSFNGGRSGNRGNCAQPCRHRYQLTDGKGCILDHGHLLSPKDLETYDYIPELIQAGIHSFKIEGRMKKPEYIAAVTDVYRRRIDGYFEESCSSVDFDKNMLAQAFNRGGFSSGYLLGQVDEQLISKRSPKNQGVKIGCVTNVKGKAIDVMLEADIDAGDGFVIKNDDDQDMLAGYFSSCFVNGEKTSKGQSGETIRLLSSHTLSWDKTDQAWLYKTYDHSMSKALLQKPEKIRQELFQTLNVCLNIHIGAPISATVTVKETGKTFHVMSDYLVQKAENHQTSLYQIKAQWARLGGVPFRLGKVTLEADDGFFVPKSVLNALRRDAIQLIMKPIHSLEDKEIFVERIFQDLDHIPPQLKMWPSPRIAVHVSSLEQGLVALKQEADEVIYDLSTKGAGGDADKVISALLDASSIQQSVSVSAPAVLHEVQMKDMVSRLEKAARLGVSTCHVGHLGIHQYLKNAGLFSHLAADHTMNATNDLTVREWMRQGFGEALVSPEMSRKQLSSLSMIGNLPLGIIVFGTYPLMISAYSVIQSYFKNKESKKRDTLYLKNHNNHQLTLLEDDYGRMLVLDENVLSLYNLIDDVFNLSFDVWRIEARYFLSDVVQVSVQSFVEARQRLQAGQAGTSSLRLKQLQQMIKKPFVNEQFKRGICQ